MKKSIILLSVSCFFIFGSLQAQKKKVKDFKVLSSKEKKQLLKSHDQAFQALNEKVRDPYVMLGPDDYYYLTGTTGGSHWGETIGIHLWRSKDLADWEDLGFVWDLYKDGKPKDSWHFKQKVKQPDFKNPRAIWAPEIHYLNGTWWIPHCLNISGHGLLRSTTGKPEGPYEALPMIAGKGIDAHLFQEADGSTYYLWGADIIAKMDKTMNHLSEESKTLKHDGLHQMGYEGVLLMKFGNKYLHIASGRYGYEPTNTYDLYYAVSDKLQGPYGKRRMAIKNAGHGNLFQDKAGKWWSTAFDHDFINLWSLWLVPIDIEETENDLKIKVKDPRFSPNEEDQKFVEKLSKTGPPKEWKGKAHWYRPE